MIISVEDNRWIDGCESSRDNERMEAGVPDHCGSPPVAKFMSINSLAVVWGHLSKGEVLGIF